MLHGTSGDDDDDDADMPYYICSQQSMSMDNSVLKQLDLNLAELLTETELIKILLS